MLVNKTYRFLFHLFYANILCSLVACEEQATPGFLKVNAHSSGTFEIYRFESGETRNFVSEQSGKFNEQIALPPGSYLVLADCSSETIIIHPGETQELVAHRVTFNPPLPPKDGDSFSIQCSRATNISSRQHFSNRYQFDLLHGKRDMLVALVPFQIDFEKLKDPRLPKDLSFQLSAVQVADFKTRQEKVSYFVSPQEALVSVTKSQTLGKWEFILKGKYNLELNGTKLSIDIDRGEIKVIRPASLTVETVSDNDLKIAAEVRGAPQLVEINSGHWLNFNEIYPILPGKSVVQINGSARKVSFEVEEGGTQIFKTKSVTVNQGCSPWEWTCLGQRDVMLYEDKQSHPFVENITDIPVLYIDEGTPIWVGVGGSRDIRYKLPSKQKSKKLNIGYVNLIPTPEHRPTQRTDLLRVETENLPLDGVSLDLNLQKTTRMPLIAGWYFLSHYVSISTSEGERRRSKRGFRVIAGETIDVEFKVFFSEKRMKAYSLKHSGPSGDGVKAEVLQIPYLKRQRAL